jgi:TonB-linked SusC/RagA family outer membrane protein
MKKHYVATLLLLVLSSIAVVGQVKIKGKVLDDKKEAIIGASILEKGTKNGTITDLDGNFSISVSKPTASLVISYIGMKSETVNLNGKTEINIVLESNSVELQEVVAVGYGTMRKRDVNGSISSVKVKDAETVPVVSVDQLLKGKSSGVYVNTGSAEPGGVSTVKIRGVSSLMLDTEPLYVVDGVAMDNVGSGSSPFQVANQKTNPLSYLNPQDIVSMEVLKDASATAIFGSRGANGVVLITTKSGVEGKPKVNVTSSVNISTIRKKIDMLNGYDYARYRNELAMLQDKGLPYPTPESVQYTNWQDEIMQTAVSNTTRAAVSGGSKTSNYYLSAGLDNNQGLMKKTAFNRGDVRFNYKVDLSRKLTMDYNISFSQVLSQMTQTSGKGGSMNWSATRAMVSRIPIISTNGVSAEEAMLSTPTAWVNDFKNTNTEANVFTKLGLTYKLSKIFSFNVLGSYNFKQSERFMYYGRTLAGFNEGAVGYSSVYYAGYNIDALLNFNHAFNANNNISGVVGSTYSSSDYRTLMYQATGFADDILNYEAMGPGNKVTTMPLTRNRFNGRLNSYLARVTYSLMNKYVLTLSGRVDGSSKFPDVNKFGFFPSTAFAWRAKEEDFLKNVDILSNLKVRVGWGQTGNQNLPSYQSFGTMESNITTTYMYGDASVSGRVPTLGNTALKWEVSEQVNAGIDIGFWKERVSLSVDVYQKQNRDMIIRRPISPSFGFDAYTMPYTNYGTLENKGIDISTSVVILSKKNIKWSVDGNISLYRNKIMKLDLEPSKINNLVYYLGSEINSYGPDMKTPGNIYIEGRSAGLFWGLKSAGVFQNQAEITQFATDNKMTGNTWYLGRSAMPGDIIYKNIYDDGAISTNDYTVIGNPNPDFTWGFNSNFSYKEWGLNIGLNGVQGKNVMNINLETENLLNGSYYNVRKNAYYGAWRGEGTSNYYPRINPSALTGIYVSDRLVEDASFMRLSNITLSYSPIIKKSFIRDLKVFVTGNNLLTVTKYSGFDPEVDTFTNGLRVGMDFNSYPTAKSIIVGFNVNF